MIHNKFIIEGDELIIGRVTYHFELADDRKNVKGGGYYEVEDDKILFYKDSHDFGSVTKEEFMKALSNLDPSCHRTDFILSRDVYFKHGVVKEFLDKDLIAKRNT